MKIFKRLLFALALRSEKLPDKKVKTVRETRLPANREIADSLSMIKNLAIAKCRW